jgi:hypothetical protein
MASETAYCEHCKSRTPVVVKPIFQGFEKVGEERTCPFCGHRLDAGAAKPETAGGKGAAKSAALDGLFGDYKPPKPSNPFGDDLPGPSKPLNPFGGPVEVPRAQNPFGAADTGPVRICRHCRHYVVNPYTQKCMLHDREVTAVDTCADFTAKASGGRDAGPHGRED